MTSAIRLERQFRATTTDFTTRLLDTPRLAKRHLFKLSAMLLATLSWTGVLYRLIGLVNKRTGLLRSVFYCYPGDPRYARHYCYAWCDRWFKWLPAPIGLFQQGGKWGLILASPVTETEFTNVENEAELRLLLRRIERIAQLAGAAEINHAGVLPSVIYRRFGVRADRLPRIVNVVCDAIEITRSVAFSGADVPIVLLGGNGFLGKALQRKLNGTGVDVRVVDPAVGTSGVPPELRGHECLLVDVARRGVLSQYTEQLWPGLVVLNETFPEPSRQLQHLLEQRGISVYHLAGMPARVWPNLPHGYRACVPCCALHESETATAIVRRLV